MTTPDEQAERVKALALEAGFSVVRVTRADEPWEAGARLKRFVGEGRHGLALMGAGRRKGKTRAMGADQPLEHGEIIAELTF